MALIVMNSTKKGRKLMKPHNDPLKPRFRIDHIISTVVVAFEDGMVQFVFSYTLSQSEFRSPAI